MNRPPQILLLLCCLVAMPVLAQQSTPPKNPASSYAHLVTAFWIGGSELCKRAMEVNMAICETWFKDKTSDHMNSAWEAARQSVSENSQAWPLLRDLRATYDSCVQQATIPSSISANEYRSQLIECDEKVHKAAANLEIELEDK